MLQRLRQTLRMRLAEPAIETTSLAQARLRQATRGAPAPIRFLLVSDQRDPTSGQQWAPLRRWRSVFRRELGLVFRFMDLAEAAKLSRAALRAYACIGLKLTWRTPSSAAVARVASFRDHVEGTGTRLIYFDGDDDLCVLWPEVLSLVDLYVKKQLFEERNNYQRSYIGKCNLTDYVARTYGESFEDNEIPRSGILRPEDVDKLFLDWNLALGDKILDFQRTLERSEAPARDIDIVCRAAIPNTWLRHLRAGVLEHLRAMSRRYAVLPPDRPVSKQTYALEMQRSRICVSPFGHGELCWRDFEAILAGCLLVKPDMGHLRTRPNLFEPGVTYVPVRWDFADLEAVCTRHLEDEATRQRITGQALTTLRSALNAEWCIGVYRELLGVLEKRPRPEEAA